MKKLTLNKESLRLLVDDANLTDVQGGAITYVRSCNICISNVECITKGDHCEHTMNYFCM